MAFSCRIPSMTDLFSAQRHRVRRGAGFSAVLLSLSACIWGTAHAPGAGPESSALTFVHASARQVDSVTGTLRLPLVAGLAGGAPAYFVMLETSDADAARSRNVTHVPRLAELRGSAAVQRGRWDGERLVVEAGVDFSPAREVARGAAAAFPPARAEPGAVGRPGYSPFVEFADGSVWNISLVADATLQHDRLVALSRDSLRASFRMTRGYGSGKTLWYLSTEASDPMVAALEAATLVPAFTSVSEGRGSAQLVAMVNGPLATDDGGERHGMQSAMAGEGDPLNILEAVPGEARYAPLWELHMAMWSPRAVRDGLRERLLGTTEVANRVSSGLVQGMDSARQPTRTGAFVNCPVVAVR